jgi:hypothetical protein
MLTGIYFVALGLFLFGLSSRLFLGFSGLSGEVGPRFLDGFLR